MDSTEQWIADAAARLGQAGYRPVDTGDDLPPGSVALRRADYRIWWLLTRLHTFVVLMPVDRAIGRDVHDLAVRAASSVSRATSGLPRGRPTDVAVLPVVVAGRAAPHAPERAAAPPTKPTALMTFPLLVDLATGTATTHADAVPWAASYQGFLAAQQRLVLGDSRAAVLGTSGRGRFDHRFTLVMLPLCGVASLALLVDRIAG